MEAAAEEQSEEKNSSAAESLECEPLLPVKNESEDDHEMTEEERKMLEPETVIKQEQDDEEGDRDFSYMTSQRGRRLVVKDDYKYCRSGPMKDGMRFACTKKECRAYLFLNKEETVIIGRQGSHDHPPHASVPPGNSRRALLGLAPRPYVRKMPPPPERKLLPKRNVVPPKHIYTIVSQESSPKVKKIHPNVVSSEEDLKIQTLIAIDEACKDLSSDNSLFGKFTVSEDAKELMTEFIWKKIETYAEDIEAFANHAGRPIVVEDDVKLLFRRNEPLLERFEHLEIELQQEEEMLQDEFYNHSDVC